MDHHEPTSSSLSFTIETFDDPETGQPTQYGRFSRHWQDEEALDVLIDRLEAAQLTHFGLQRINLHLQRVVLFHLSPSQPRHAGAARMRVSRR